MNRFLLIILALLSCFISSAQNFSGQWKGEFIDKSTKYMGWGGNTCEYVLDLECSDKKVSGFSYTYFTEAGKRFYTICKLEGFYDTKNKYLEIKEIERTKTNVPANVMNCFQVHKLSFFKKTDGDESIEGTWIPAPNQEGNCGYGLTTLSRRSLKKSFPGFKNPTEKANAKLTTPPPIVTKPAVSSAKANNKSTASTVKPKPLETPTPVLPKKNITAKNQEIIKDSTIKNVPKSITAPATQFKKRNNTILKTIEVENESIKIDLYDNGEIDGDSVSLFLNNKLLVTHKKLTTQPLTIVLPLSELNDTNELVMYADNLGTIPPNTAIMIVTDGNKRYEVRITSDLEKSGTIKFIKKK